MFYTSQCVCQALLKVCICQDKSFVSGLWRISDVLFWHILIFYPRAQQLCVGGGDFEVCVCVLGAGGGGASFTSFRCIYISNGGVGGGKGGGHFTGQFHMHTYFKPKVILC